MSSNSAPIAKPIGSVTAQSKIIAARKTGVTQMMLGGGQGICAPAMPKLATNMYGLGAGAAMHNKIAASRAGAGPNMLLPPPSMPIYRPQPKTTTAPNMQLTSLERKFDQDRGSLAKRYDLAGSEKTLLIQGGSLRTWSYKSPAIEQVQVVLQTEGRPLDADIELWQGPDNTPVKMRVYCEDGFYRPFSAVIETPRSPSTVSIKNIGQIEFPIAANCFVEGVDQPSRETIESSTTIQGGALRTYPFDPRVESVEVLLRSDGRPLNARIELLQGPNNNKQVIELYSEDGLDRPFFMILETPGAGNVVRVVNTAPVEFPMLAGIIPHEINNNPRFLEPQIGGDVVIGGSFYR